MFRIKDKHTFKFGCSFKLLKMAELLCAGQEKGVLCETEFVPCPLIARNYNSDKMI
jgi:hypothetical protein